MRTRVVNLKLDHYDVYIGRVGKSDDGYFGNPFRLDEYGYDRLKVIELFRRYFEARLEDDKEYAAAVEGLRGKSLGCFCMPKLCHGMVIVEHLEGLTPEKQIELYMLDKVPSVFDNF